MQKKLLLTGTLITLFSAAVIITRTARGQSAPGSGLVITPPTFELAGNPGATITNTVRLENTNDYAIQIAVDRRNFTAIGEEGAVGLTEEETTFSLASWITVDPQEITIPPKGIRTFKYTITVPLQAEPGGHFGSLIFRTIPTEKLDGSGAALAQEIGSLILLRIAGDTKEDAAIDSFAPQKSFYEYGPVTLETRMKNNGNVHVKPSGTIAITNIFGQKVATVALEGKNVLPGAVRRLDATWDTKWRFGRYTATLVLSYGKDQVQRAAVTTFTVIPYKVTAIAGAALLLVLTIIVRSRKRIRMAWKILMTGKA